MAARKKKSRHEQLFLKLFFPAFAVCWRRPGKIPRFSRNNVVAPGAAKEKLPCGKTVHAV
jgi:hypothetical protein